jgi:hypothetical protein
MMSFPPHTMTWTCDECERACPFEDVEGWVDGSEHLVLCPPCTALWHQGLTQNVAGPDGSFYEPETEA